MVKGRETRKNRCLFILWMLRIFSLLPSHFATAILHKTLESHFPIEEKKWDFFRLFLHFSPELWWPTEEYTAWNDKRDRIARDGQNQTVCSAFFLSFCASSWYVMTVLQQCLSIQILYLITNAGRGTSERGMRRNRTPPCVRSCLVPRSLKSIGTEARKTFLLPTSAVSGRYRWRGGIAIVMLFGQIPCRDFSRFWTPYLIGPLRLSTNRGRVAVCSAIPSFKCSKKL